MVPTIEPTTGEKCGLVRQPLLDRCPQLCGPPPGKIHEPLIGLDPAEKGNETRRIGKAIGLEQLAQQIQVFRYRQPFKLQRHLDIEAQSFLTDQLLEKRGHHAPPPRAALKS